MRKENIFYFLLYIDDSMNFFYPFGIVYVFFFYAYLFWLYKLVYLQLRFWLEIWRNEEITPR